MRVALTMHQLTAPENLSGGNGCPLKPDLSRFGKSRIGRKRARKVLDRYFRAVRRYEGRPARSGPPIRNSEKFGRREFYSVEQAKFGGRRSGQVRRAKAAKKWREVELLRRRGQGIRQIAALVGYSPGWVSRLVKRLCRVFPEHIHRRPKPPPRSRILALIGLQWLHLGGVLDAGGQDRRDTVRFERLRRRTEGRITAYLNKLRVAAPGDLADVLVRAVAEVWCMADGGVAEGTRRLNEEHGYC